MIKKMILGFALIFGMSQFAQAQQKDNAEEIIKQVFQGIGQIIESSNGGGGSGGPVPLNGVMAPNGVILYAGEYTKEYVNGGYWKYWRCGNPHCSILHKQFFSTNGGGNDVVDGRHPSQHGIRWYKYDGKYWTAGSNIDHMPYRYIIRGKHYAMTRDHFINYFGKNPPQMEGNGFYPVDDPEVTTVNKFGHAYQKPQAESTPPVNQGVTREELLLLIQQMQEKKDKEQDEKPLTAEDVIKILEARDKAKAEAEAEAKKEQALEAALKKIEELEKKLQDK